jgi:hypothetical protein
MNEKPVRPEARATSSSSPSRHYERPSVERIALDCEISSYAPDSPDRGDVPLF